MKPKPIYVVLAAQGTSWEPHGPLAPAYNTLKEAETAAHDLSIRYPHRTLGVYELRSVFGTQQKVVKQKVEIAAEKPIKRKAEAAELPAENVVKFRVSGEQ